MSASLRVLVVGSTPAGVCDFYRTWMFQPYLAELGIELRAWLARHPPRPAAGGLPLAWEDRAALEWADVVVFRRADQTHHLCLDCRFGSHRRDEAERHAKTAGHAIQWAANEFLRPLWAVLESEPRLLGGRALVYETDDDLLRIPPWNGNRRVLTPERDLVEAMLRRADLVTVSTPVLAERMRPHSPRVRVIRNALDPTWYAAAAPEPDLPGDPRVLHYGNLSRLTQYAVCREAVDEAQRRHPSLRRVWLGAPDEPALRARLEGVVDEVRPYVVGVPAFARALVAARPDVGLAPLAPDDFDLARSELHWLEYALAGAVTVASRTSPAGPYTPIRNGIDGFLVKNKAEWLETLLRLARSPGLRTEVAGRARERVLAEYDARRRALEWAAAFRWAADHAGIGRLPRTLAVDEAAVGAVRRTAQARLAHRLRVRRWEEAARSRLERIRSAPSGSASDDRLVSVLLAVVPEDGPDGPALAGSVEAAVRSVLDGLHPEVEVVGIGPEWLRPPVTDPRVRWLEPDPGEVHSPGGAQPSGEATAGVEAARARALNRGLAAARGSWVATLEPGVVLAPEHLALLLEVALDGRLEAVYGWLVGPDGDRSGHWPPDPEDIPAGCELVSARFSFVRFDPRAPLLGRTAVAERWRRLLELGIRVANVETDVAERRSADPAATTPALIVTRRPQ